MRIYFLSFFLLLYGMACNQNVANDSKTDLAASNNSGQQNPKDSFFPVTDYLLGQIKEISEKGINPILITSENGKIDTQWIKTTQFQTVFSEFISPRIDSVLMSNFFKEKSFFDQTIHAVTLTYDPIKAVSEHIPFQRWDVYIDPETQIVKRIFLIKSKNAGKEILQLTWVTDSYCKIIVFSNLPESPMKLQKELLIKWKYNES